LCVVQTYIQTYMHPVTSVLVEDGRPARSRILRRLPGVREAVKSGDAYAHDEPLSFATNRNTCMALSNRGVSRDERIIEGGRIFRHDEH
jgi:hypothetical protein